MAIKQDPISILFSVLAISELLFLTTFGGSLFQASVIAVGLMLAGIVFNQLIHRGDIPEEDDINEAQFKSVGIYAGLGLIVFFALAFFVPLIPPQFTPTLFSTTRTVGLAFTTNTLFLLLIAVAEEQFFRGFLTNFFVEYVGPLGLVASGGVFAIYHFAVYGSNPTNLLIVFGAGVTLAYISWATGRISPTIIAHVANNLLASGIFGATIYPQPFTPQLILPAITFSILAYTVIKNRGLLPLVR